MIKQKVLTIMMLFFFGVVITGCTKEYDLTLDYGFGKVETTSYKNLERVNVPLLKNTVQDGTEYTFCGWAESKDVGQWNLI